MLASQLSRADARGWWGEQVASCALLVPAAASFHKLCLRDSSLDHAVCSYKLTTFSDGCLGSNNDEGRSEVR